jgi:hypothetical protein
LKQHEKNKKCSSIPTKKNLTNVRIRHPNFDIKGNIVHLIFLLSFHYYYVIEICTKMFMKMKGNINRKMGEKMKMRESLE